MEFHRKFLHIVEHGRNGFYTIHYKHPGLVKDIVVNVDDIGEGIGKIKRKLKERQEMQMMDGADHRYLNE